MSDSSSPQNPSVRSSPQRRVRTLPCSGGHAVEGRNKLYRRNDGRHDGGVFVCRQCAQAEDRSTLPTLPAGWRRRVAPREAAAIEMYFGLDGKPRLTVEEIAQRFGVSHTTAAKWRNQGLATLGVTLPKRGCIPSRTVWCPDVRHGNRDRLRPRTGVRSCRAGHPIEGDNRVYGRARNGAAIYVCRPCAQEKDLRSLPQLPDDWRSRVEPGQVLVIEWYFGIGGPRRTMEQIAQELGVQQPCVQKRRDKALRRLGIVLPARSTVVSRTLWDVSYRHPKLT